MHRFREIADREGREMNKLVQEFMKRYINEHGDGNNQYKLTKWYDEQSEFKATPAFLESNDKWDKYISDCDHNELARIQGQAQVIKEKAGKKFLEVYKRGGFAR